MIEKNRRLIKECIGEFLNCDCSIDSEEGNKPITFFHWDALNIVNKIEFLSEIFKECEVRESFGHLFKIIEEETEFGKVIAPIEFNAEWMPIGMVGEPIYNDLDHLSTAESFQLLLVNLQEEHEGFPLYSIDIEDELKNVGEPLPFLPSFMELNVKAG